ncbi:MAG TPA: response regulator, partial [Geobacteraceae bacterium]
MAEGIILIIDDDIPFAETMRRSLALDGYTSVVVSSGQEALNALEVDPEAFDLALLDMRLPDTDGL